MSYWDFLPIFTLGGKSATGNNWNVMCESLLQFNEEKTKGVIWSIRTLSSTVLLELASFKQDVYHSSLFTFCLVFARLSIPRTGNSTNAGADCYCRWKYFYSSPWWIFFFFFRSRVRIMRQPVGVLYAYQDKGFDSAGKNCFCWLRKRGALLPTALITCSEVSLVQTLRPVCAFKYWTK